MNAQGAKCSQVDRVGPWLEDELGVEERATFEAHLEVCDACRQEVQGLRRLLAAAASLPKEIEPPRDLWPAMEKTMEKRSTRPGRLRRVIRSPGFLAAAAVLVAAVALGLLNLGELQQGGPSAEVDRVVEEAPSSGPAVAETPAAETPDGVIAAAFDPTLQQLHHDLARQKNSEPTEPQRGVLHGMDVLEMAIGEIRSALREEPSNQRLQHRLLASYQKQVELLTLASRLSQNSPSQNSPSQT